LVLTEGAAGGTVYTTQGAQRFPAPSHRGKGGGAYGAGDSFAGALTYFLAKGLPVVEACTRAGYSGAAVLGALEPLEAQERLE
jgi:ribokinase